MLKLKNNSYLREFTVSDTDELFNLIDSNRKYLSTYLAWVKNVNHPVDTEWFINKCTEEGREGFPTFGIFIDEKLAGVISYHVINKANKRTSLGYWIGKSFSGNGLVTMSVKALLKNGFENLDLNRIAIHCAVCNIASQNIPKKLGFTEEGIEREAEIIDGKFYDHVIYSMLKSEFKNLKD
jgi:ribosomal-protein-serine acetyltransferase